MSYDFSMNSYNENNKIIVNLSFLETIINIIIGIASSCDCENEICNGKIIEWQTRYRGGEKVNYYIVSVVLKMT